MGYSIGKSSLNTDNFVEFNLLTYRITHKMMGKTCVNLALSSDSP